MTANDFCLGAAGGFFFFGLLSGAWKYACIARSQAAQAPAYVDVAHRSSLLYAFACALLGQFAARSAFGNAINFAASALLVLYFAVSVLGYAVHGALRDTDNQLRRPHVLGKKTIPAVAMRAFMVSLIVAEIGAFTVLLAGWASAR